MSFLTLVSPLAYDVMSQSGVDPTGATDSTTGIQNAINAVSALGGGVVGFPYGTFLISSPLTVPSNVCLIGSGANITILQMSSGFSGAAAITLSGITFSTVERLSIKGFSSTYSSNPAADGIDIIGSTDVTIRDVYIYYVNGWCVASTATSGVGNTHILFKNVFGKLPAQGIHILGVSGSGYVGTHRFENTTMSGVQNGDCYLLEDIHDITGTKMYGECAAGSGSGFHFKGAVSAVDLSVFDIGPYPGPSLGDIIQISSGPNGSPKNITMSNGTIEGGTNGVTINAGSWISLSNCKIFNNNLTGVNVNNSAEVRITDNVFNQNGSVAGSGRYEMTITSTGDVFYQGNKFMTPQGNTAGAVNSCINDTGTNSCYNANYHDPNGGWNTGNIFVSGNTPRIYQNVLGLTAQGIISTTTPGSSPYTLNGVGYPRMVYVSGGTVSSITLGGTSTGRTAGEFYVPPRTALAITFSAAPTVVVSTVST